MENKMAKNLTTGVEHATSSDRSNNTVRTARDTNQSTTSEVPLDCCRYCDKRFNRISDLVFHIGDTHTEHNKGIFNCTSCIYSNKNMNRVQIQ